jgi:hypothetical protein
MINGKRAWLKKYIAAITAFLACFTLLFANAAPPDTEKSPATVATDFYRWYVKAIATNRDPIADFPTELSTYVSKSLIAEIRHAMVSEDGLEADYFIQAQDYLDDWSTNARVTRSTIHGSTATIELELGASAETRQRLALTLIREQRAWKIRTVRLLQ